MGKKIAWFGDINNVSNSYVVAAPIFKFDLTICTPRPSAAQTPSPLAKGGGLGWGVTYSKDPLTAAQDADVIVTDTWVSLGQDGKATQKFLPYQVNADIMNAAKPSAIFMHCLPIHEWEEVSEDVAKGSQSVIYDEAENRLHVQKAILAWCLEEAGVNI